MVLEVRMWLDKSVWEVVFFLKKRERKRRLTGHISVRPSDRERLHGNVEPLRRHHPSGIKKDSPINLCKTFQPIRIFVHEWKIRIVRESWVWGFQTTTHIPSQIVHHLQKYVPVSVKSLTILASIPLNHPTIDLSIQTSPMGSEQQRISCLYILPLEGLNRRGFLLDLLL